MFRAAAFFFLALLSVSNSIAQQLLLDTYTPANGLVDARIIRTFQDSRGIMYFLTKDGFSIFDGQHFDNYTTVGGIPVGIANDIIETKDRAIHIFNFSGDIFVIRNHSIRIDTSRRKQFSELNKVIPLGPDDRLYLTNFHIYREKDGRLSELHVPLPGKGDIYIENAVVVGPRLVFFNWNFFWSNQLTLYNFEKQEVEAIDTDKNITNIQADRNGNVFFSDSDNKWWQLNREALNTGKLVAQKPWFASIVPPDLEYIGINFDNHNHLWMINAEKGCYQVNTSTNERNYYRTTDGLISGINHVFQDQENNYWFVTIGRGVQKLQQSRLNRLATIDNLPIEVVSFVNPSEDGDCFISSNKGTFIANRNQVIATGNNHNSFSYWMGQTWKMQDYKTLIGSKGTSIDISNAVPDYSVMDYQIGHRVTIDHEGRLVIPGKVMIVVDRSFKVAAARLPYFGDDVVVDKNNHYWSFLRNNEVFEFAWENGSLQQKSRFMAQGLNPRTAIAWNTDTFYVGTRNDGIRLVTIKEGKLNVGKNITRDQGLSNNFVFSLLKTSDQEMVSGTATGLDIIRFSPTDTTIECLSARNNIFSPFDMLAMDKNHVIYGKTQDAVLFRFNMNKLSGSDFRPTVGFRSITVNGIPVEVNRQNSFSYTKNNFIFSISAPSFLDNRNIRYHFLLEGKGKEFEQQSGTADYVINNLQPGRYTLTATISFPGKVYDDKIIQWSFAITPPFWKSWWFLTLVILSLIGSVVWTARSYFRRQFEKQRSLLEKQQAVEKERTRIATDMHDDFGASLSRIKFLSEKMQLPSSDPGKVKEDLGKISTYSDEMAEKMGEIVWALNQRYDSSGDLVSFCRSYASEYFADKNIKLQFSTGPLKEVSVNGEIRRNIFLVMKESLHNVVRHAGASVVNISIHCENELLILIHDNGRGFDPTRVRPFANGLENMKKRMEEIGGRFTIQQNNGTLITIAIDTNILQNTYS